MAELTSVILSFLKAIGKYRWHAVIISWCVALIGWGVVYTMPDDYQASARVYVDTQSVLKPLLAGMTTLPNVEQQVAFMRRTLISRPNVEKVMRMVDLDVRNKTPKEHEEQIDRLTSAIKIVGTERDDIYTITYNNSNPKLGKDVVQSLLTIFVEGSFGGKKGDSEKAVQFIDEQIKSYEEKLSAAENSLKEFKIKHMGLLPRTGSDYTGKISDMADQLSAARLELAEAEQARNALRRQMGASADSVGKPVDVPYSNPELDGRIQTVNKNLDALRMQFTEEHPDIVAAKRLLAQLEAKRKEEAKNHKPGTVDPGASYSPMLQQMTVALSTAEARVASLRARVDELASRSARLKAQSVEAPDIEAQLAQLNRDYEVNRENYQKLVERRESAKLSGELSSATDMMTFRVIDPPIAPTRPIGPNRPRLMSVVLVLALAAGLGVALLMSQFRPTFLSQSALREATGLPILGSIGMNWTDEQKKRHKKKRYALWASVLALFGAYGAAVAATLIRASA
ncbi:MAG: XrtA system polysaccharide chain length determinant [Gammaproteobacteria bacterium]